MNTPTAMEPWIETSEGNKFWFTTDDADGITVTDIAASLSKMCRFTGHCKRFYSVAEHSVHVSRLLPEHLALAGLLHDASEAYLADIASPVKQLLPDYKRIEEKVMAKIAKAFDLPIGFDKDPEIKKADWSQLKSEAYHLLPSKGEGWFFPKGVLFGNTPGGLDPESAQRLFLETYNRITR